MPSLELLQQSFEADGVQVIGVNYQENPARIQPFLRNFDISMPVLRDHDGSARARWGVRMFPSTFVIAPDQTIAFVVEGEGDWQAPPLGARVREVVQRQRATATGAAASEGRENTAPRNVNVHP